MLRALPLTALALALVLAAAPARADGTYFTFGLGPAEVSDDLGAYVDETFGVRLALGHRVGALAIEGYLAPEGSAGGDDLGMSAVRLGVDARYLVRLASGVQLYARGGLGRMDATLGDGRGGRGVDYSGRGIAGGVGVQLRGKVRALGFLYWPLFFIPVGPKVNASLFVDHGTEFYRLHPEGGQGRTIDARLSRLTFGFNVGADF
ncbi:MAG: outer membrane beta-barrel protein [Kofleriaceae bacterium]|jgi:hypothetical protein|nr:outer membrane beta-barrel protein [Kofleriaceae bacterium]MBP9172618.1 outer membrane beta-barrel protein [Kofleriaceae bacterium]MBP9861447.1 outer membrane beta-barrel protein [Kofleriaceae bacterium]